MSSTPVKGGLHLSRVLQEASISQVVATIFVIIAVRWVATAIYRAYFHPLSRFPGPTASAISSWPTLKAQWNGSAHLYIKELHEKYGDKVRVAPNEISFIDPQAWKDVFAYPTKANHGVMPTKHWARYGKNVNGEYSLINAPDADHTRMRRIFNSAFSDRALKQQEPLFMKYADLLVTKLGESVKEDPERKFDMVRHYNFATFDVMGDLTFGESLHMLDNAEYDPWVSIVFGSVKFGSRLTMLSYYPILKKIFQALLPASVSRARSEHHQYAVERVTKRLDKGRESEGVDLWDSVLGQKEGQGLSRGEMDVNSSLFMLAGTETTATLLSGFTYFLLRNPETMQKLTHEIRSSFSDPSEIHMDTIATLPYLNACLREALRLYPPVATGLPRLTPPAGSTVCGEYIAGGYTVSVPHYAMYTSARNFKDPHSYIPERWTEDERFADDNKATLHPFSYGKRDCIGKNMAYHEMRLIANKLLYNFDLELCPESAKWIDQDTFALWKKGPLMCKLRPVN